MERLDLSVPLNLTIALGPDLFLIAGAMVLLLWAAWRPDSAAHQRTTEITIPVAVTVFPGEIYRAPRSWTERAYPSLAYFNEVDKGGHFAAWEQPELFARELRAAFRRLR